MSNPTKPIPIRMDADTRGRVMKAAKRLGSTNAAVIRLGVLIVLPQLESGTLVLPRKAN